MQIMVVQNSRYLPISGLEQSKHVCGRSSVRRSVMLPADSRPDLNRFSIRFLCTASTDFPSRHFSRSTCSYVEIKSNYNGNLKANVNYGRQLNGSMKEPNKFHIYETEKITRKASDAAEYIELFGSFIRDHHA